MVIYGYPWLSMVITIFLWLSIMVIYDYLWLPLPMVIYCYLWLLMVIYAYPWLFMLTYGYLNLLKKYCAAIFSYTDRTLRIVALWHRERQLCSKWITFFPHFCLFTARGMLSKRSADRIGMRTVTSDRERERERIGTRTDDHCFFCFCAIVFFVSVLLEDFGTGRPPGHQQVEAFF